MNITRNHQPFLVPEPDIRCRIEKFQTLLRGAEIDIAVIQHPADHTYFTGSNMNGICLIPAQKEPVFYVKTSLGRAEREASVAVEPFPGRKGVINRIKETLSGNGRIGLAFDVSPAAVYAWLAEKTPAQIADITGLLRLQKSVKSVWETEQIRQASLQAEILFQRVPEILKSGMTETQASIKMEMILRESGHAGSMRVRSGHDGSTWITVASGDSALYPTNFDGALGAEGLYPLNNPGSGRKIIQKGETVMIDTVTAYNGYHADHTRTFFMGRDIPDPALVNHQKCLDILADLAEAARPGRSCQDVFKEVMQNAEQKGLPEGFMGYGENRVRFFGHGIGLELDEFPVIADRIDFELKEGMILAMEPKSFIPGIGGLGAENTFIIEKDGCKPLCAVPLEIIGID